MCTVHCKDPKGGTSWQCGHVHITKFNQKRIFTYDDPRHHEAASASDHSPHQHEVYADGDDAADYAEGEEPRQVDGGGGRHVSDLLVSLLVDGALLIIPPDLVLSRIQVSEAGWEMCEFSYQFRG